MNKLNGLVVAAVAAGVVVAGCGGSDAPSKADYTKKGNAICAKGNKQLDALGKSLGSSQPTPAALKKFAGKATPVLDKQIKDLRALKTPKGDGDKTSKIYDAAQSGIDKIKADPSAFTEPSTFANANKLAKSYGLTTCAS